MRRRLGRLGLGQHLGRKDVRDVVRVDGDHRDRLLAGQRAEHRDAPCRAAGRSGRRDAGSTSTRSPCLAPFAELRCRRSAPAGGARPARCGTCRPRATRKTPSTASRALLEHLHDAAGIGRARRPRRSGRSLPARGRRCRAPGRCRRAGRGSRRPGLAVVARSIRSAGPAARRRRSRRRCRARTTCGSAPARAGRLRSLVSRPSSCRSRSRSFSQMRSSPFSEKALAMSRLPDAVGIFGDEVQDVFARRLEVALGRAGACRRPAALALAGDPPRQDL